MLEKTIPSSGAKLPVIGLGTWQTFDVGTDASRRSELAQVLETFRLGGARLLDTSPMYGSSEAVLGALMPNAGGASGYFVATKVWTRGEREGAIQMRESMRLLGVERVDLMQVHNLLDAKTHLRTLSAWKADGTVGHVGLTHYTRSAYPEVERAITSSNALDFLQINYSLAEREAEQRILPLAAERGLAVLANRPFAEGALFQRVRGKAVPGWAQEELDCASWAQYFLKFIVSHPAITAAIPATSNPRHLADNLAAGAGPMPDAAQRERMAKDFAAV